MTPAPVEFTMGSSICEGYKVSLRWDQAQVLVLE